MSECEKRELTHY